jgi:large subunit ribosomal protein L23
MALFGTSKKKNTSAPQEVREVKDVSGKLSSVLTAPWLSEKALIATEKGIYTFHVPMDATKKDVALAIKKTYNVTPRKVTVVNLPAKKVSMRTRRGFGMRSARRKAYVHLKKGDTIQFA